jgi:hypothetical protein
MFIFSVTLNVLLNSRGRQAGFYGPDEKPIAVHTRSGQVAMHQRDSMASVIAITMWTCARSYKPGKFAASRAAIPIEWIASGPDRSDGSLTTSPENCAPQTAIARCANRRTTRLCSNDVY